MDHELAKLANLRDAVSSGRARTVRVSSGISQREMARAVGVDVSTVCRWELGERRPHGEAALRYADALDALAKRGRAGIEAPMA